MRSVSMTSARGRATSRDAHGLTGRTRKVEQNAGVPRTSARGVVNITVPEYRRPQAAGLYGQLKGSPHELIGLDATCGLC